MATYTTPLRAIIEQPTQYRTDLTLDQKIEVGRKMLFDFDYPMFDNRYKKIFETNFINNFYDREIGFETEYLFKRRLQNWLNINMPYWSQMFESEQIKFDPLINSEMNVNHTKKNDELSNTERNFGETTGQDTVDRTVTDEDTRRDLQQDVEGSHLTDTDTDMTGNVSGESSGSAETIEDASSQSDTDSSADTDRFNRNIYSDTPDTRMSLTVNDGSGLLNYASNITEDKGNENTEGSEHVDSQSESTSNTTTSDETNTDTTQNQTTKETGTTSEHTDLNETGERDETVDRTIGVEGKRDFDENIDGKINNIEDFVQHRIGKIGVQTYSKMLMEYRASFLRIERDIFKEMNQLFMLVY